MNERWNPSAREEQLIWYLRLINRYMIGGGGLVWAMASSHLEPILLMILGAVATSTDVLVFAKDLFSAAREETRSLESEMHRDTAHKPQMDGSGSE